MNKASTHSAGRDDLATYRAKRDFTRTAEPKGRTGRAKGHRYLIQKHDARRLHYDLRLEMDGVLKSWAVTRGPSLDPADKRLAVQVEDHPLEYGSFEGIIPAGEYGGGTVMLWDKGTWEPLGDPHQMYRKGRLTFKLDGKKLKGEWHLVRMRRSRGEKRINWLLIKSHDDAERPGDHDRLLSKSDRSVKSGKTLKGIERDAKMNETADAALAGIKLTHPDRVLYPDAQLTKRDLAQFYLDIADRILPHVIDRPLSIVRCPDGQDGTCFYQKHLTAGMPSAIRPMRLKESGGYKQYVSIHDAAGLAALVQFGVLEIHPWGCAPGRIEVADRITFDLDPDPAVKWPRVVAAAKEVCDRLADMGLESFLKTTGGKGLHVVVPLSPPAPWARAKAFAQAVAMRMAADSPSDYLAKSSKAARRGKIFVDYLRNDRGSTSVAPYSTRAKPGATVSLPLAWNELSARTRSDTFNVSNVRQRLKRLKRDPWRDFFKIRQTIDPKLLK